MDFGFPSSAARKRSRSKGNKDWKNQHLNVIAPPEMAYTARRSPNYLRSRTVIMDSEFAEHDALAALDSAGHPVSGKEI